MTQAIVIRMSRKEIAEIDSVARSRAINRSTLIRQATRKFVAENKNKKGVGWSARLRELERLNRDAGIKPTTRDIVGEIRAIDRNRAWPA